jgi:hypothetical protein
MTTTVVNDKSCCWLAKPVFVVVIIIVGIRVIIMAVAATAKISCGSNRCNC